MDMVNREGNLPYDTLFSGPPALTECMLDFGRVFRGNQKTLQQIIANTTKQPMIWLADAGESTWVMLEPHHGVLQPGGRQSIRVTADTSTLEVGEYSVTLTFSSEGDETSMRRNTISKVKVEESPMQPQPSTPLPLAPGPHLGWLTPQSTHTVGLVINNPDTRPIDWEAQVGTDASGMGKRVHFDHLDNPATHEEDFAAAQHNAVSVNPSNGSLNPGESATLYVTANAAALEPDYSYTTNLTLTSKVSQSPDSTSTSVQVPVSFHVSLRPYNDGGPKVPTGLPPDSNTSFTIPTGSDSGTTTLSFTNIDPNPMYWTLNPDPGASWLVVNPPSGYLDPGQPATVQLTAQRAGLQAGPHSTNLHLLLSHRSDMGLPNVVVPPFPVKVTAE